jgi:hypothetical protein
LACRRYARLGRNALGHSRRFDLRCHTGADNRSRGLFFAGPGLGIIDRHMPPWNWLKHNASVLGYGGLFVGISTFSRETNSKIPDERTRKYQESHEYDYKRFVSAIASIWRDMKNLFHKVHNILC